MDTFITEELMNLLIMGATFSIFEMAFVQKLKMLPFFNKDYKIWLLNFFLSFLMGIPFAMFFFQVTIEEAFWVSLFGFIGAPSLYATLKKQNLITYKPQSCPNNSKSASIEIPKENEIKR